MDTFIRQFLEKNNTTPSPFILIFLTILAVWSLLVKGIALWHAAKTNEKPWFIAILILNTVGVLEVIYLLAFSKKKLTIQDITLYLKSLKRKH